MKIFSITFLVAAITMSSSLWAHSFGHGEVSADEILYIAQKSAKMLTFKDQGMSVGKIDNSWNTIGAGAFKIVEQSDLGFIVKATNDEKDQTLYFEINPNGQVRDVKDASSFSNNHGHNH